MKGSTSRWMGRGWQLSLSSRQFRVVKIDLSMNTGAELKETTSFSLGLN